MAKALMLVWSSPVEGADEEFLRWYDAVHVPEVRTAVPAVENVTRYRLTGADAGGRSRYLTVYELADGDAAGARKSIETAFAEGRLEMTPAMDMPGDPRDLETWSSLERMWRTHPLTIERFSYVTLGVKDLDAAVKTYADVIQAVPLRSGTDEDLRARYTTLRLGDCLLQIAEPADDRSDLGRHVATWGNMIYGLRFEISDVGSAESWLNKNGVRTTRPRDGLIVTDPEDSLGAPIFFGTEKEAHR